MDREEVTKWLTIIKANLNSFPEVSNAKKIEALGEAIRFLKNEESEKPTSSDDCISRQDVLSEIIRFSTEEGSSVECQQLYCDVNNMPSVTPIRPKGCWIWEIDATPSTPDSFYEVNYAGWVCSCCHKFPDDICEWDDPDEPPTYKFCPNCGAEMESEDKE